MIQIEFDIHDFWLGVYWKKTILHDVKVYDLWICLIPFFPLHITISKLISKGSPSEYIKNPFKQSRNLLSILKHFTKIRSSFTRLDKENVGRDLEPILNQSQDLYRMMLDKLEEVYYGVIKLDEYELQERKRDISWKKQMSKKEKHSKSE